MSETHFSQLWSILIFFWRFLFQRIYFVYLFAFLYIFFYSIFVLFIWDPCHELIFLVPPEAMDSKSFHYQSQVSFVFLSIFFAPCIDLLNNFTPSHGLSFFSYFVRNTLLQSQQFAIFTHEFIYFIQQCLVKL